MATLSSNVVYTPTVLGRLPQNVPASVCQVKVFSLSESRFACCRFRQGAGMGWDEVIPAAEEQARPQQFQGPRGHSRSTAAPAQPTLWLCVLVSVPAVWFGQATCIG